MKNKKVKLAKTFLGLTLIVMVVCSFFGAFSKPIKASYAESKNGSEKSYFTIFDVDDKSSVVFFRGDKVEDGDMYISSDNKRYEIVSIDEANKTGYAKFIGEEDMPVYKISKKISSKISSAFAEGKKTVGVYHTHNDESYIPSDGYDSVYGKGGIHDVGKALVNNFGKLGISAVYSEDLHLPHNSGAYTRSEVTASALINNNNLDGLFDIHRDSTPAKEYITTVDGKEMSKVRMVVGRANQNSAENLEFAKSIKAYADEVYPNLIKDIFIGKGNYNQQLTPRAMLFEMGCENIKKDLPIASTEPLAKTIDVVLYGSNGASNLSLNDVRLTSANGKAGVITGLANNQSNASLSFLWVLLGAIAFYFIVLGIVCIFSKTARYKTKRFFSELFAGLFVKQKHRG
ncbi:MAG: stage II sporulation protein P [Clostridia bacterium]|nr:stage II sporulation protein P [Clostridia bacterium]